MRRAFFSLTLALALAGCGETILTTPTPTAPQPPPHDLPRIPPAFAESLVAKRKVDGLKIRVYNTGLIVTNGHNVSNMKSTESRVRLPVPVFLIKHPKKGYVLFDTGIGPSSGEKSDCLREPVEVKPGQDILSQLRADRVDPGQVAYVILSHLHREHAAAVTSFPSATVIVDRREWQEQKAKQAAERDSSELDPNALEPALRLMPIDLTPEPHFGAFDHGFDLFGDGTIVLVDLSGHTAGSMGAWINLDSGPVLLAGDATWLLDNHQDRAIPKESFISDVEKYWRRIYAMRAMQEAATSLVIYPGHDLTPLALQPRADVSEIYFAR